MWDVLLVDCHAATMAERSGVPYGAIENAAIGITGEHLSYVGPAHVLPQAPERLARSVRRLNGAWITPGLIDCHTHLVFAGNRAREWEMRLAGATYQDVARAGGRSL